MRIVKRDQADRQREREREKRVRAQRRGAPPMEVDDRFRTTSPSTLPDERAGARYSLDDAFWTS